MYPRAYVVKIAPVDGATPLRGNFRRIVQLLEKVLRVPLFAAGIVLITLGCASGMFPVFLSLLVDVPAWVFLLLVLSGYFGWLCSVHLWLSSSSRLSRKLLLTLLLQVPFLGPATYHYICTQFPFDVEYAQ